MSKLSYGIDFGTTNSTICVVGKDNRPQKLNIDPEASNPAVMRSVIYVNPKFQFLFGKPAVDAYLVDVAQNKSAVKKTIFTGKYIKVVTEGLNVEMVPEVIEVEQSQGGRLFQSLKSALSNESISDINIFGKLYSIDELVGMFIKEIKQRADEIVGEKVTSVIIGRPVEYVGKNNDLALKRMEKALKYAGFKNFAFEYEPVGAALDYGISIKDKQTALVFDFGGGTLDISIFELPEKKILANVGLPIGGDYFNTKIFMNKIAKHFGSESVYGENKLKLPYFVFESLGDWYKISLLKTQDFMASIQAFEYMNSYPKAMKALESLIKNNLGFSVYEEVERVKKSITDKDIETYRFVAQNIDISEKLQRKEFENLILEDLYSIKEKLNEALDMSGVNIKDIDFVATTGGSSLIPVIKNSLGNFFGNQKIKKSDAFTSVASGLSLKAREIFG